MERLQKIIAESGYTSRRKAEELIKQGKVFVNGVKVVELGTKASFGDIITVNGVTLQKSDYVYFLLNKPRGVVSTAKDEKGRKTVVDLIDTDKRIYPIGRLDYDTTGLILLTNDGELTNKLTHPKGYVEKTYIAKVSGIVTGKEIHELEEGIELEGVKTKKARAKLKKIDKKNNKSYVELTITEGRNHQVKNMFAALGHKVLKLKRISYAFFDLEGMKIGEYRRLTTKEVKQLYNYVNIK